MGLDTIGVAFHLVCCIIAGLVILQPYGVRGEFKYLGCYKDQENDRDIRKMDITFGDNMLTVADCAQECHKEGWPFIGLQKGYKCFCGNKYGTFGMAQNTDCNFTCNDQHEFCGGVSANSVYYALDTSAEKKAQRSLVHYEVEKPFDSARQECVKNDGDLALIQNTDDIAEVIALFADVELSGSERKVIFGLSRNPPSNPNIGDLMWTDASVILDKDTIGDLWVDGENWQNSCAVLDIDTEKFETTSCYAQYPFVCSQAGVADSNEDFPDEITGTEEEEEEAGASNLALAIVLPIFAFCYGGSCLLYCAHKLHKNCKRKRRKKLLEQQEAFSEFEPDTKPINPKDPKDPYGQGNTGLMNPSMTQQHMTQKEKNIAMTMSSAVLITNTSKDMNKMSKQAEGPAEESQPEPSTSPSPVYSYDYSQKNKHMRRMSSRGSVQSMGPVLSSRPTTSEAVHISMDESPPGTADPNGAPPGYYQSTMFQKKAKQVREEKRRNRLLENALREARQRRAREQSALSRGSISSSKSKSSIDTQRNRSSISSESMLDQPPTPPTPQSVKSARSVKSVKLEDPPPPKMVEPRGPIPVQPRNNPEENPGDHSGDSLTSLIDDERKTESPDDPTQMSIADIMKVKMMMKARKKRVRKILGT